MRKIEQKMIDWLDAKLAENGTVRHAVETGNARLLLIQAAYACVGIREIGGNNKGAMVELIQETIGGANKEAWCMAFVQTLVAYVEHKLGVKSRLYPSEHCLTTLQRTEDDAHVKYHPLPGAIVIWQHGASTNGHTGIYLESKEDFMMCIEGNTEAGLSPSGKVERDGGGIYLTKRSMKRTGDMKVVGFLKPF